MPTSADHVGEEMMEDIAHFCITWRKRPHWHAPGVMYWVTFTALRPRYFSPPSRDLIMETILFDNGTRHDLHGCVVMPDHVHMLTMPLRTEKDAKRYWNLGKLMQSWKIISAKKVNKHTSSSGSVWKDERHDHIVRDKKQYHQKLSYLLRNPVKAGLVRRWQEYEWTYLKGYALNRWSKWTRVSEEPSQDDREVGDERSRQYS